MKSKKFTRLTSVITVVLIIILMPIITKIVDDVKFRNVQHLEDAQMIKFADNSMIEDLKPVWKDAFNVEMGPYWIFYLTNIFDHYKPLVYMEDGKPVSMLTVIPVTLNGELRNGKTKTVKGLYVYAVGTLKEYRGRGIATKLLNFVDTYAKNFGKDFEILIPAEESLVKFYSDRDYTIDVNHMKISITRQEMENIAQNFNSQEYKIGIDNKTLLKLRRKNFNDTSFIEWGEKELEKVQNEYTTIYAKHQVLNFDNKGYAIVDRRNEDMTKLDIREFYIDGIQNKKDLKANPKVKEFMKTLLEAYPEKQEFNFVLPENSIYIEFFGKQGELDKNALIRFNNEKLKTQYVNPYYFNFGIDS